MAAAGKAQKNIRARENSMNKIHVRQVTLKTVNATVPKKINTREILTKKKFMQLENFPP